MAIFVISKVLLTKHPNVSICQFCVSKTSNMHNSGLITILFSDLTKKSAWYCKEKVFSSGDILSKIVQFLSHVKQLLFLEEKVSVYTILCQEEKKNMLTLAETFRGNATKTECILMHCSRKSTNNVRYAYFP